MEIVTRWFGAFLVDKGKVVQAYPFPTDRSEILDRWKVRAEGTLTPEERAAWEEAVRLSPQAVSSRDARFRPFKVRPASGFVPPVPAREQGFDPSWEQELLQRFGTSFLETALGPSQEIGEGVRSIQDMEAVENLLAERLANWWVNEAPAEGTREDEGAGAVARQMVAQATEAPILLARRRIAQLVLDLREGVHAMEAAVETEANARLPNLSALLGPMLAARLVEKAGGLERLAKLPSGTLQILGAERAFFDHLRTGRDPPKYGLLFLHPAVQAAPVPHKGRVARILAGKAAIAARRDLAGAPALPELSAALEARLQHLREVPRPARPSS